MTRKPSSKPFKAPIDKSLGADVASADVKGMPKITLTHIKPKPFPVKHVAGAKHGIINLGQPPKKFPARHGGA